MPFLFHDPHLDKAEKVQLVISYLLQLTIIIAGVIALIKQQWLTLFLTTIILILTFLPALIRRSYRVHLPVEFDLFTIIFVYAALFLGEVHLYYVKFWWWDLFLHTMSGILFGIAAFVLVYVLNEEERVHVKLKPAFLALFSFAFAMMIGVLWEIFEFALDNVIGLNMQKSGLTDTMWDLIVDAVGALIIAVVGYFYVRKGDALVFKRMIRRFVERNPHLFQKRSLLKVLRKKGEVS